jgi:hypothetical protein
MTKPKRSSTAIKQYRIADTEHAEGGATLLAESPADAARLYCERECHDVGDGDTVNVTVIDPDGNEYEAAIKVHCVTEYDVSCVPRRGSASKGKRRA